MLRRWGKRRVVVGCGGLALGVVLLLGVGLYLLQRAYDGEVDRIAGAMPTEAGRPSSTGRGENWLLIGSDKREDMPWMGARADAIMLVHLSEDGSRVSVIAIPRDGWVPVPGHGTTKINAAFAHGGPSLLIRTVERLTKVRVDHYAALDFNGFVEMTDALGGVDVTITKRTHDPMHQRTWEAGRHHLNGVEALDFVRQRWNLPSGDLDRIKRQQAFMASVVKEATDKGMLTDPGRTYDFLSAVTKSIKADDGLSLSVMQKLAGGLRGMSAGKVRFVTVPVEPYPQDPNRVQFNRALAEPLFKAVREDNKLPERKPVPVQHKVQPVPPAQVRVGVYNGAGTPGLAQRTADQLAGRGFQIVKVGTANRRYARTQILYGAGAERQAARMAIAVPGPKPRPWRAARPGHVYLVIGQNGAELRVLNAKVPKVAGEVRADRDVCEAT